MTLPTSYLRQHAPEELSKLKHNNNSSLENGRQRKNPSGPCTPHSAYCSLQVSTLGVLSLHGTTFFLCHSDGTMLHALSPCLKCQLKAGILFCRRVQRRCFLSFCLTELPLGSGNSLPFSCFIRSIGQIKVTQ